MNKTLLFFVFTFLFLNAAQGQKNLQLRSHYRFLNGAKMANIGGFAKNGKEYALVGTTVGLTIIDVTDPDNPVKLFDIGGTPTLWREVKTWGNYAYVTNQGDSGLKIIDLSNLPSSVNVKNWTGSGGITFNKAHTLHIDQGFVYLNGTDATGAWPMVIASLADPWNPQVAGTYGTTYPDTYVHDCYVRNDTIYACKIYNGTLDILYAGNKSNPVLIGSQKTPLAATHNAWLSDNGKSLFVTDEADSSFLVSYNITDPTDIRELDRIKFNTSGSVVHNTHVWNDFTVNSWYTDGVVIIDARQPDNLIVIGNFDTSPKSGPGTEGCWGVYPFLPSGNILATDIDSGLFVLTPKYTRACYLRGMVYDSITKAPLKDVEISISGQRKRFSDAAGSYKTGMPDSGFYSVNYNLTGYYPLTFSVNLKNGLNVQKNIALVPTSINIENGKKAKGVVLAPNPFSSELNVFTNSQDDAMDLEIYDIFGDLIYKKVLTGKEIKLGKDLLPGVYFLKISSKEKVYRSKIIKE